MLSSSVQHLRCPKKKNKKTLCHGSFRIHAIQSIKLPHLKDIHEIRRGQLECTTCRTDYPILSGVALIVPDVRSYLLHHVKGIAQVVPDSEIPREFLREYLEAKSEIQSEHIEEDLEAERVTALYIMNHYLSSTTPESHTEGTWWTPKSESSPPFIDSLIKQYWDRGPFHQISEWLKRKPKPFKKTIELGCGVGGLYSFLKPMLRNYLGVDSSFGSIAIARHLALGLPYSGQLKLPEDLIQGPVSRRLKLPTPPLCTGHADFIVGDLDDLPVEHGIWDLSVSLNTIDMLEEPFSLPKLQFDLIQPSGLAIQSCPYIWHPLIAKRLRKALPPQVRTSSSRAVEWMYEDIGFQIEEKSKDIPWLFFKHVRQLEIYSVHAFVARKP
jgi:hypothetical protein